LPHEWISDDASDSTVNDLSDLFVAKAFKQHDNGQH
jgi:hypothetical protein